uniref:Uncharacterized protein n=1 Tax=Rhizophora mucronata TaxID=61149 RepID=A0A2P2N2H7_RHIMU
MVSITAVKGYMPTISVEILSSVHRTLIM